MQITLKVCAHPKIARKKQTSERGSQPIKPWQFLNGIIYSAWNKNRVYSKPASYWKMQTHARGQILNKIKEAVCWKKKNLIDILAARSNFEIWRLLFLYLEKKIDTCEVAEEKNPFAIQTKMRLRGGRRRVRIIDMWWSRAKRNKERSASFFARVGKCPKCWLCFRIIIRAYCDGHET